MIKQAFKQKKAVFIPFIMAGHPSIVESMQAIAALSESGADIIELGVPFSDPVADGPVNQRAAEIALSQGVTLSSILSMVRDLRLQGCHTPIVLFSYYNPIFAFGCERFARQAKEAGVNGVLIVDLPPEEGHEVYVLLKREGLDIVLLASPTTDPVRFSVYRQLEPSFVYYISRLAVTGVQEALSVDLEKEVSQLRTHLPGIPIAVGFGISTQKQASIVAQFAEGVVVGSLLVNALEKEGLASFSQRVLALRAVI
jgi:tryptophan synthase alpha chain